MKHKLVEFQGEINEPTLQLGLHHSSIKNDRFSKEKNSERTELNSTALINWIYTDHLIQEH